ncbi:TIM-barrel domain-containing protein [Duncaniella freteri]|uniref:glycoside hydrolase family 31 protein n=1 Tax=Duncaniella freteri TaxID=2530391 RepID=UPI00257035A9|nr:TIM-barrel domain-containing protein [Duncaniella freteri]
MRKYVYPRILLTFICGFVTLLADSHNNHPPKITFITPSIVRVHWSIDSILEDNNTGICVYKPENVDVRIVKTDSSTLFMSPELSVEMMEDTYSLSFKDHKGVTTILRERHDMPRNGVLNVTERIVYDEKSARIEDTANGKVTVKDIIRRDTIGYTTRYINRFCFDDKEALYGLGSHMEDYMNLNGKTLYLTQHNLKVTIPVLVSTKGYGLMFDAGCAMKFDNGTFELDAARSLDYYFINGGSIDNVVSGYRHLTGKVSLPPRYVFGYTQSKERYTSSDELIATLSEYRRRHIPIDMIVQDWNYWPEGWGYMKMNRKYYPDPKALADSVHRMNARLMISIWPNPQYCPQEKDFREKGYMLDNSVYDVFNPDARKHYWKYANDEFFSNGFDAWWCDSSEPLDGDWNRMPEPKDGIPYRWGDHERRWSLNKDILSTTLGAERSSLYSLYHSKGIYENQRATSTRKRVVNLTRSSYAGQQRYGTIVWNGDTHASWASFRQQIPAGLNYMATGNPYWTVDVGSFFTKNDGRWFYLGEFPDGVKDDAYKEYYTRMFQWGTFLPMLRSHGSDTPREIWRFGEPGTRFYDAILRMINLRYTLIPYIYSMAARQTLHDYTMARLLAFDFPDDPNVFDIKDQYMFGNIMVCPVTAPGAKSRKVYLPHSSSGEKWTDYWSGTIYEGGGWIDIETPIDRLPLFVRGGSLIPTAQPTEYADAQIGSPITINVYPGRDSEFEFYEDEGDNYNYESGSYTTIRINWNDRKRILTLNAQKGSYPGMPTSRKITIKTPWGERSVNYNGKKTNIRI